VSSGHGLASVDVVRRVGGARFPVDVLDAQA
jgi:hypothetical protein